MLATVVNIALSFAGVVIFGAAMIVALLGAAVLCIARKGDRPVELSLRGAGMIAIFIGIAVARDVCNLLADIALL